MPKFKIGFACRGPALSEYAKRARSLTAPFLACTLALFVALVPMQGKGQPASQPADIACIFGATFPSTYTLYAISPDLLCGWNGVLRDYEKKYIPAQYQVLPVLGGWYGQGMVPDREMLLAARIKQAFVLTSENESHSAAVDDLAKLGINTLSIWAGGLADYPALFRELGNFVGMPERGMELANYGENILAVMEGLRADLKPDEFVRVYYAQGVDGLNSTCRGSLRSEALDIAGGVNVLECPPELIDSFVPVSLEQLMVYEPEVIIIHHEGFYKAIRTDQRWSMLAAVKNGRYYYIPPEPFNWLDRPASYMRFLGVQWLWSVLHPDKNFFDIDAEAHKFIKLFFNLDLDQQALAEVYGL